MAAVVKLSSLTAPRGRGIATRVTDTQFETNGLSTLQTLTASADSISTTLDAPAGTPVGYQAIGFKVIAGDRLDLAAGADSLSVTGAGATGAGTAPNAIGVMIGLGSTLNQGIGNDSVLVALEGAGSVGVQNAGSLLGGDGLDKYGSDAATNGLVNTGTIDTGNGADRFDATSSDKQAGSHAIKNTGTITMGTNDQPDVDRLAGGSLGHGVLTAGYTPDHAGIYSTGTINMGGGKDVIDALVGGFAGNGTYNLGGLNSRGQLDGDADSVMGFGQGTFNGGGGRNSITLPGGTYTITYTTKPLTVRDLASGYVTRSVNNVVDTNPDTSVTKMNFTNFDGIGGFDPILGALHFVNAPAVGPAQTLSSFTVDPTSGAVTAANYV